MTKNRMMTYAKFEALEEQVAHCYFLLYGRFIENPLLAKFWVEAAMDELQRYWILRFCRESGMMADGNIDFTSAGQIEESLKTVKDIVTDPELSIDEAFCASLLMESSDLEGVYEKLTSALAKNHRLLSDAVQTSLRSHYAAFADAAEEFCSDRDLAKAFKDRERMVS